MIFPFSELPCSERPPTKPEGGTLFYDRDLSKYACPEGMEFQTGNYFEESECTQARTWQPKALPKCARKCWCEKTKSLTLETPYKKPKFSFEVIQSLQVAYLYQFYKPN